MIHSTDRRAFLRSTVAGSLVLGCGEMGFLSGLPAVSAAEATLDPDTVRMQPEIEPLVRLLEETPRERLLEEIGARIHRGLTYREVLAALLLAGVRNVQPRPSVGFKFHAVLVVNSAHLASLNSKPQDRWLPIFWALDYFKSSQAQDVREGNWTMSPVDESALPPAHKAKQMFLAALDDWDEGAADVAVASLARTAGSNEIFEIFARYGSRDFRSIGHKAIFVANSWRTLECIGWRYAEPVLRSLAYALLNHGGDNPAGRDDPADLPYRRNVELVDSIRSDWLDGANDDGATLELLAAIRDGAPNDASDTVLELLNRGVSPQSIWDGLFDAAGELLSRQPGIIGLHTLTTTNAMHHAYTRSADDQTRRLLMLQNAAFLPMFRERMPGRGPMADSRIDHFEPLELEAKDRDTALGEIFAHVGRDSDAAAGKTLSFLSKFGDAKQVIDMAQVLVYLKGRDSHDYKFSSAVLEDYYHISPAWRDKFLAAAMYQLPGSSKADNGLVERTRAALA